MTATHIDNHPERNVIRLELRRNVILQSLDEVEKVSIAYFNSMIVQMFSYAKKDQLVEMWKVGTRPQKERVIQIMTKIDPANSQRYREIGS